MTQTSTVELATVQPVSFLDIPGCHFSKTGLEIVTELSFKLWKRLYDTLLDVGSASNFWIGDALVHGQHKYGEKYSQAIEVSEKTGYALDTIRVFQWVSNNVGKPVREAELSWSHHRAVGALSPMDQSKWLKQAVANEWSIAQLRHFINEPPAPKIVLETLGGNGTNGTVRRVVMTGNGSHAPIDVGPTVQHEQPKPCEPTCLMCQNEDEDPKTLALILRQLAKRFPAYEDALTDAGDFVELDA